jgi:hypothetical protein
MRLIMSRVRFRFPSIELGRSANGMSPLEELRRSTEWQVW